MACSSFRKDIWQSGVLFLTNRNSVILEKKSFDNVIITECTYLNYLFLRGKSVDNFDEPCFLWQYSNKVTFVLPPRSTKVICPIRAWEWWRNVNKSTVWAVGYHTSCQWVNMGANLQWNKSIVCSMIRVIHLIKLWWLSKQSSENQYQKAFWHSLIK